MPLTFPSSPTVGQTYNVGTRTWTWDGSIWSMQAVTLGVASISTSELANGAVTQAKMASTLSAVTICTSSTRPGSPFTGQVIFETDTNKMKLYNGSSWIGVSTVKKVASFSSSGSWTVPAGVTYAVAHIRAGGGGAGRSSPGAGGNSSVAFSGGTVTATGGNATSAPNWPESNVGVAGVANSGDGGKWMGGVSAQVGIGGDANGGNGAYIVSGGAVTPASSIAITIGNGGTAGTGGAAGGSGYVWIEYEE